MTTLAQLRRSVRSRLGIPVTDGFQSDDVIDDTINMAMQALEEAHRWPWQERVHTPTVFASTSSFDVPADWRATRSILWNGSQVMEQSPTDLFMQLSTDTGNSPESFAFINRTIHVRPYLSADTTVTHIYYRDSTELTADTDTPDMPAAYSPAIVAKACELLSLREGDRAAAGSHLTEYQQWVGMMRKDVERRTGPVVPRERPGSWMGFVG